MTPSREHSDKGAAVTVTGLNESNTMRPEYDFSGAVRGVTAVKYAEGAKILVADADVRAVFPDDATVDEGPP